MGLDLYIEARIVNRKTERILSLCQDDEIVCDADKGFFEICWWCGWEFLSLRKKIIEIANRYNHSDYSDADLIIPIQQAALREVYYTVLNSAYLPDDTEYEWEMQHLYESTNLLNAKKLHDLIRNLLEIQYYNEYNNEIEEEKNNHVSDTDWKDFIKNPQDFKWEFRIFNSY